MASASAADGAAAGGAPIRRMIIEKIVQENFKSYAGRVEIGPFHKVSVVRGWNCSPNGYASLTSLTSSPPFSGS